MKPKNSEQLLNKIKGMNIPKHIILLFWVLLVLFPIWTMLVNSFKTKLNIFQDPFGLPKKIIFDGYISVIQDSQFFIYFRNSLFVTIFSILLILLFGSMAAYAIASWRSKITSVIYIFFIAGLMIPIRLGTINIFQLIKSLGLVDSIFSLFPVYIAMGLPIAVFVLTEFIRSVPRDLIEAGIIDGASKWRIYWSIILPLLRPALATVAIFNLVPIWNDLWFPLIFINDESQKTVILGVSSLFGQYQSDWTKILAVLTMSSLPVLLLYLAMSKQFIKGLTSGAVKG